MTTKKIQIETLSGDTDSVNQSFTSDTPHDDQQAVVFLNGALTIEDSPNFGFDPVADTNQIETEYAPKDGDKLISMHVKKDP